MEVKTIFKITLARVVKTYVHLIEDEHESEDKLHDAVGSHNSVGKVKYYIASDDVKHVISDDFNPESDVYSESIYGQLNYNQQTVKINNQNEVTFEIKNPSEFDLENWCNEINTYLDKFYPVVETVESPEEIEEVEEVQDTNSDNLDTLETYRDGYFYEKGKSEALQNTLDKMFYFKK